MLLYKTTLYEQYLRYSTSDTFLRFDDTPCKQVLDSTMSPSHERVFLLPNERTILEHIELEYTILKTWNRNQGRATHLFGLENLRAEGITLGYSQRDVRVPSFQLLKNTGCAKAQDVYMASLRFWVVFWTCFYSCCSGVKHLSGGDEYSRVM